MTRDQAEEGLKRSWLFIITPGAHPPNMKTSAPPPPPSRGATAAPIIPERGRDGEAPVSLATSCKLYSAGGHTLS